MLTDPIINQLCKKLDEQFHPQKILIFHCKRNGSGDLSSFKICMIIDTPNILQLEREVYLAVECEIPFDILVYTPQEWEKLSQDAESYAAQILKNGVVYHGKES